MKSRFALFTLFLIMLGSSKFLPHAHMQDTLAADSASTNVSASTTTSDTDTTSTETNAYLEALMIKQTQLKQALAILNNETQYLHNTLQKLQGLPEIQVIALEDALADELNILSDLASDHQIPFEEKEISCSNISEGDITVLQASVTQIEHDLSEINGEISQTKAADTQNSSSELIKQLQLQAEWVQNYLNKLKSVVTSLKQCPEETTTSPQQISQQEKLKIIYVSNPDAVNWIYGDLSPSQYYTKMLKYISDNKNGTCQISTCPIGTPYFVPGSESTQQNNQTSQQSNLTKETVSEGCFQCPDDLPLFDVSLNLCVACSPQDGVVFIEEEHMCIQQNQGKDNGSLGESNVIVCDQHPQMIFNPDTNKCECPNKNEFFNGEDCILCNLPSFWNKQVNQCQSCPSNGSFFYNIETNECQQCPEERPLSTGLECQACALNQFFDISTLKCMLCQGNKFFNPIHNQCQCREDQPFYNGTQCSTCPIYQQYSVETKKCTECASDKEFYNISVGECQQCPQETPVGNMDFCLGCPENTIFDKDLWVCQPCDGEGMKMVEVDGDKKCTCPPSTPYLDLSENKCVSCYLPKYWNQTSNKCQSCPSDMIYSREAQKCTICPVTAPLVIDGRCAPCPYLTHFNYTTGTCTKCPGSLLYLEQIHACIVPNCQLGSQWNEDRLQCLEICKGNSVYDSSTQNCICPPETPYYNNQTCVSCYLPQHWDIEQLACTDCELEDQYFNLELQKCVFCGYHEKFNFEKYRCEPVCMFPSFYNETQNKCNQCPEGLVYSIEDKVCAKCPIGAQLIVEGKCFACPNETHYDSEMNKCLACPDDTFYNPNLNTCVQKCKGVSFYNSSSNRCVCPLDIPFYDGQKCSECYFPKYWQKETQSCQYCPPEQYFNTDQEKCTPCQEGYELLFHEDALQCRFVIPECPHPMYYDLQHHTCANCPTDTIYSLIEKKCIGCPENRPLIINNTCEYCPSETHYDSLNKKCVKCRQNEEVFSKQLSKCVPECHGQSHYNFQTKKCECPTYRPFYDGLDCVSCYIPKYWDIVTHSCQYCPTEQYFSVVDEKCVECQEGYHLSKQSYQCVKQTPACIFPKFLNIETLECVQCNYKNGEIFDFSVTKTCIQCPSDKPLIVNYQCKACEDGTFFDEDLRVCVKCQEGTNYLRQSKTCQPICVASSQQAYNPETNNCECIEQNSFLNFQTKQCVKCELPRYWDYLSNSCKNCEDPNTHYNQTLQKCDSCPYRSKFDLALYRCVSDETICQYDRQQYYNYTLGKCLCPQDKPYFTSSHICVSCGNGDRKHYEYWNSKQEKCVSCDFNTHYDPAHNDCVVCPASQIFNSISGKCENICPESAFYNKQLKKCECTKEGYHWNGDHCAHCATDKQQYWMEALNSCAKCPQNSYFNLQVNKCAKCPEGFVYNHTQKLCTKVVVSNSCQQFAPRIWFNSEKQTCECPSNTPYYSAKSNTCIDCPQDQNTYWSSNDQKCYECPSNHHYDKIRNSCITCPTGYVYNVQKSICLLNGGLQITKQNPCGSEELSFNNTTRKCECIDNSRPYFNGEKCVSCSSASFWNEATRSCEECAQGLLFDKEKRACVSCKSGEILNTDKNTCEASEQINVNPISSEPISYTGNNQVSGTTTVEAIAVNPIPQASGSTIPTTQVEPIAQNPSVSSSSWTTISVDPVSVQPTSSSTILTTTTSLNSGSTSCPKQTPYWDKQAQKCVVCYLPKFWNHDTSACQSCPLNKNYDITQRKCVTCNVGFQFDFKKYQCVEKVSTTTSIESTTTITTDTNTNNVDSTNVVIKPENCPSNVPFWNGEKCVACYLPKYWNTSTLKCSECPSPKHYDISVKKCVECANKYNTQTFKCE